MKAIIYAGGSGTQFYPMTLAVTKQILPVYDKPLIYYPLAALMAGGVRDFLVVAQPRELPSFAALIGDGRQWGLNVSYAEQPRPDGPVDALIIAERFIGKDQVVLAFGDNIFYGNELSKSLTRAFDVADGATGFASQVDDPSRFCIVNFDAGGEIAGLERNPIQPKSNWAMIGLYVYDNDVVAVARTLMGSARGDVAIADVNAVYLARGDLAVHKLGRGFAWFDTATKDDLLDAANFVAALEKRLGLKIASPEETALRQGFIAKTDLERLIADRYAHNAYGRYLKAILDDSH